MGQRKHKHVGLCECGDHAWTPLTRGYCTLVSPFDDVFLRDGSWYAFVNQSGNVYASARTRGDRRAVYLHRVIMRTPQPTASDPDAE
jgi:hypothetical protein